MGNQRGDAFRECRSHEDGIQQPTVGWCGRTQTVAVAVLEHKAYPNIGSVGNERRKVETLLLPPACLRRGTQAGHRPVCSIGILGKPSGCPEIGGSPQITAGCAQQSDPGQSGIQRILHDGGVVEFDFGDVRKVKPDFEVAGGGKRFKFEDGGGIAVDAATNRVTSGTDRKLVGADRVP